MWTRIVSVSSSAVLIIAGTALEGVCRPAPPALGLLLSEWLCVEEEEVASAVTAVPGSPAPQEALSPALLSAPCGPCLTLLIFYCGSFYRNALHPGCPRFSVGSIFQVMIWFLAI